ncbi:hypothetical protein [Sporomusa acidovorans]|uniref:Y-family DNA polymerase n=1 Tax=Sporomusa acidovorans TaxID=112900 RepID=UPI001FDFE2D9|nr:hypothetical protein [Sporomusa acidovorans]
MNKCSEQGRLFLSRTILHVDLNSFYASVECLYRPEIREKPVAVCGDAERLLLGTTNSQCRRTLCRFGNS